MGVAGDEAKSLSASNSREIERERERERGRAREREGGKCGLGMTMFDRSPMRRTNYMFPGLLLGMSCKAKTHSQAFCWG